MFNDFEVIHSYTRAEALADGVLIDVSETAKETGFTVPVAMTTRLWHEHITPGEADRDSGQSERGRLWDVLSVLYWTIKGSSQEGPETRFKTDFIMEGKPETVEMYAVIGPGDSMEPVITIMLIGED